MAELIASEVVENLATQFSSALDCYRELVQNAIDAGSPQVDVWMEFIPSKGHTGTITVHVDDFGEGMDEHIIDSQLTRLFASSKEDDLTKIGKFGIGFVSVFALNPRGVLVRTGRGGEYWEVFFDQDRSFIKTRLHAPEPDAQPSFWLSSLPRHQAFGTSGSSSYILAPVVFGGPLGAFGEWFLRSLPLPLPTPRRRSLAEGLAQFEFFLN